MWRSQAFTLIEILVVLALLAILASISLWLYRMDVAADAKRLAAIVVRLRAVAVVSGVGATVWGDACLTGLRSSAVSMPSTVTGWPPRGLLFTPDGLPRTCDGGGVGNTTILLEHRGRQAAVIVSSLGRVRWEMR